MNQAIHDVTRDIKSVGYALDNLEVKGRVNLDIVLGCIQQLDRIAARLTAIADRNEAPAPSVQISEMPAPQDKPAPSVQNSETPEQPDLPTE